MPALVSDDDAVSDGDSPPAPPPEAPPEGCDSATLAAADGLGLGVFVGGGAADCAREGDGLRLLDLAGVNEDVGDGVTRGDLDTVGVGDGEPAGRRVAKGAGDGVADGLGLLGLAGVNEDVGDGVTRADLDTVGVGDGEPVGRRVAEGNGDGVIAGDKVGDTVGCAVGELADGCGEGETVGEIELTGSAVAASKVAVAWSFPAPPPAGGGFGLGEGAAVSGAGVIGRGVTSGGDCGFGDAGLGVDGVGVGDPFDLSGLGLPAPGWPVGDCSPKSSSSTRRNFKTQLGCASALDVLPYSSESPLHL